MRSSFLLSFRAAAAVSLPPVTNGSIYGEDSRGGKPAMMILLPRQKKVFRAKASNLHLGNKKKWRAAQKLAISFFSSSFPVPFLLTGGLD